MSKQFFEVFPSVTLPDKLKDYFEEAEITRVSMTKDRKEIHVYFESRHLIPKPIVWEVEDQVKQQLFSGQEVTVYFHEHFTLSSLYTPKQLMELYQDSIKEELKHYNFMDYCAFSNGYMNFPKEDTLVLTIEDNFLNRDREQELIRVLEKILIERCGLKVSVHIDYMEPKVDPFAGEDERKLQEKVHEISVRAGFYVENKPVFVGAVPKDGNPPAGEAVAGNTNGEKAPSASADKKTGDSQAKGTTSAGAKNAQKGTGRNAGAFGGGAGGNVKRFGGKKDFVPREEGSLKRSDNPDVIFGRDVEEAAMPIEEIIGEMGEVVIRGQVQDIETREIRNEKTIFMFDVSDFTDSIRVKIFIPTAKVKEFSKELKSGIFVKIKGISLNDKFDHEISIASVTGIQKIPDFTVSRKDMSLYKRVELHCHTKMSDMDGVSECKALVKTAYKWGHRAMAVTDHGVVQGFTDAGHLWDDLWKAEKEKRKSEGDENPDKQDFFRVLYGVEAYLVDDMLTPVTDDDGQTLDSDYVVFDLETTGLSPVHNKIIEIGAVKVSGGKIVDRFSTFVNPEVPISFEIEKLTSIRDEDVKNAETIEVILPKFLEFCEGCLLVAHNAEFDVNFIKENALRMGIQYKPTYLDTVAICRVELPGTSKYTLDAVAKILGVPLGHHHRAVDDAECTAGIFLRLLKMMEDEGITELSMLNEKAKSSKAAISKLKPYHCIILAKNDLGRTHLYHLVSESHLDYFSRFPKIPKSRVEHYRDGLIVGSACEAGELYRALVGGQTDAQIARIVSFYDYLEIQPVGNNEYMIESPKYPDINTLDDIRAVNKRVVALGEQFHKPVVATCDVHFLNPEDEVYRRIIMASKGFEDADKQAPLYLHTTEEMLQEFSYLGEDKAREVVITNTNMIADMCETIAPVRPDKCPPVIENSDKLLRDICYNRAHEIYGPDLPEIVEERLQRELNSIIGNGYAVMYIIAQKLVWKSVEDGYLVGSRGSVGSSFVATMSGITEINPLSPHYYCSKCHYVDFYSDEVKAYAGKAGIDMPDKLCPVCGEPLCKDGFDIPFETFLGFKGDKEPDIDLNFSGEYQAKSHKYTEVIFGAGQTFRAGTIAGLADKTAFGLVKKYFEERGINKRNAEVVRLAKGCEGVRRSSGQHPGGIVVLPLGQDMCSFTPLQHPANDMTTDTITTHFDYHSIDHNLLKLDILGHDDPTMIRMLQDLTGVDPVKDIPLDGKEVMSLFQNTDALGIKPEDMDGIELGTLGIPEFGTPFAMQMLIDTKPQAFSDLVRIAGLAHGTDVWLGNAETLIKSGQATISTAICTRDDIMTYLIGMGVEPEESFKIMEAVRKGMVAKGKVDDKWAVWKQHMQEKNVPDWYIWSCQKIMYMFPKAHAAAYVMMAWRIAYCKIHYPQAYYAAFFSIRAKAFSYEIMCMGKEKLLSVMKEYKRRMNSDDKSEALAKKEEAQYNDMKLVLEMYARGFEFMPIDLKRVKAKLFQVIDGKIMPSLTSIDGIGENAADQIVEGVRKSEEFLSRQDFRERCGVGETVSDLLYRLGILGDLPETNQISLFDFL